MRTLSYAALAASAVVALCGAPAIAQTDTAPSPEATSQEIMDSLVEALQNDLGVTPEQFIDQANEGERLSVAADHWEQTFDDAFGGVWLDASGTGVVGVADGKQNDELRAAAEQEGFIVHDVSLTRAELAAREDEVKETIERMPSELKSLVISVRNDPSRNAIVVVTRGGTNKLVTDVIVRLEGLAIVDATESPDSAAGSIPFRSQNNEAQSKPGTGTTEGLKPASGDDLSGETNGNANGNKDSSDSLLGSIGQLMDSDSVPDGLLEGLLHLVTGSDDAGATEPGGNNSDSGTEDSGYDNGDSNYGGGDMFEQVPEPANPVPSDRDRLHVPVPADAVPGGTPYQVGANGGYLECSTGFNAELNGRVVVVTAGHCAAGEGSRASFPGGEEWGTMTNIIENSVDSAIIVVDDNAVDRFRNNLVGTGAGTTQNIDGGASPVVGQKACKMGSRTGYSCGIITEVNTDINVAGTRWLNGAFTVDLCALPGDSGGVVFSGSKALGISSASNVATANSCGEADTFARSRGFTPHLTAVPIDAVLGSHPGLSLQAR